MEKSRTRLFTLAERRLAETETTLGDFTDSLRRTVGSRLEVASHLLESIDSTLEALSPPRILARGYIACETPEGLPVVTAASLKKNDRLKLSFKDGQAAVKVEETLPSSRELRS